MLSVPQLAEEYEAATGVSVSKAAIQKHFKSLGVPRDLNAKVQAKAAAMVAATLVADKVAAASETETINSAAATVAAVLIRERKDIQALRSKADEYRIELDSCGEDLAKRTTILKALADIQKTAIGLERQAFGIADNAEGDKPSESISEIVRKIIRG